MITGLLLFLISFISAVYQIARYIYFLFISKYKKTPEYKEFLKELNGLIN
jgi:hypothetical protein